MTDTLSAGAAAYRGAIEAAQRRQATILALADRVTTAERLLFDFVDYLRELAQDDENFPSLCLCTSTPDHPDVRCPACRAAEYVDAEREVTRAK